MRRVDYATKAVLDEIDLRTFDRPDYVSVTDAASPRDARFDAEGALWIADAGFGRVLRVGSASSGTVTSRSLDCGKPGMLKAFVRLKIVAPAQAAGTAFSLSYSVDGKEFVKARVSGDGRNVEFPAGTVGQALRLSHRAHLRRPLGHAGLRGHDDPLHEGDATAAAAVAAAAAAAAPATQGAAASTPIPLLPWAAPGRRGRAAAQAATAAGSGSGTTGTGTGSSGAGSGSSASARLRRRARAVGGQRRGAGGPGLPGAGRRGRERRAAQGGERGRRRPSRSAPGRRCRSWRWSARALSWRRRSSSRGRSSPRGSAPHRGLRPHATCALPALPAAGKVTRWTS